MSDYLVTDTELTSIANAIRTKGGTSASLSFPTEFVSAINDIPSGGGTAYTLVGTYEISASTTSTSATLIDTIQLDDTIYTADALIYIKVRDKAGKRANYFYGTDNFFLNTYAGKGVANSLITMGMGVIYSFDGNGGIKTNPNSSGYFTSTNVSRYGVFPYSITKSYGLGMYARYSSNTTGTINGTYTVEVYLLGWPDNASPISSV
jgi:hypothetical protein